nr:MAG TPA: hypothetical protein [Herelleviridae sp.]
MRKTLLIIATILMLFVLTLGGVFFGWFDIWFGNKVNYVGQKIDDATRYETIKEVEDTCRTMIASYEADKLTWEQYKDSDSEEKQSWAEQAKMRANKTASTYNNYILKNSFVWEGNVPDDIRSELEVLK